MIEKIRKHSKLIIIIFSSVMIAFIIQEVSIYFLNKNSEDDKGDIIIVEGDITKYYEYKNRLDRDRSFFVDFCGFSNDSPFVINRSKSVAKEIINEKAYNRIAKNLNFKICDEEAIDLFNKSKEEEAKFSSSEKGKSAFQIQESIDERMEKIAESKILSRAFLETEEQRKNNRNQTKIKNIIDSLSFYTKVECEKDFNQKKSTMDIEYLYIPSNIINEKECLITDELLQKYIDENFYDNIEKEKYKIKCLIIDFPLSDRDVNDNEAFLSNLKDKFSKTRNSSIFVKTNSDFVNPSKEKNKNEKQKNKDQTGNFENFLNVEEDKLPDVIKNSKDRKKNDVFVEIAKTSKDTNKLYKILKIKKVEKSNNEEEEEKNKNEEKKDGNNKKSNKVFYKLAVIYKKPQISTLTRDNIFNDFAKKVKGIKKTKDLEDFAKKNNYKITENIITPRSNSIGTIPDSRKIIIEINKKCNNKFGEDVFVIKPIKQDNKIVFGIVSEHIKKGVKKNKKEIVEKKMSMILNWIKNKKLFRKISEDGLTELSFAELCKKAKDTKFNYIKYGKREKVNYYQVKIDGFGVVDFKLFSFLEENNASHFMETKNGLIMVFVKKIDRGKTEGDIFESFYKKNKKNYKQNKISKIFKRKFKVYNNINQFI